MHEDNVCLLTIKIISNFLKHRYFLLHLYVVYFTYKCEND